MARGLEGRRIAVIAAGDASDASINAVISTLEGSGALVQRPRAQGDETGDESQWHGGMYAGLVVLGIPVDADRDRVQQLVREFLVSNKPVGAVGDGLRLLLESGAVAGRRVAAGTDRQADAADESVEFVNEPVVIDEGLVTGSEGEAATTIFAEAVVREFSRVLEEHEVDEMSAMSFPASDPPAVSPTRLGGQPRRDADRT